MNNSQEIIKVNNIISHSKSTPHREIRQLIINLKMNSIISLNSNLT